VQAAARAGAGTAPTGTAGADDDALAEEAGVVVAEAAAIDPPAEAADATALGLDLTTRSAAGRALSGRFDGLACCATGAFFTGGAAGAVLYWDSRASL